MTTIKLSGLEYNYVFALGFPPDAPGIYVLGKWEGILGFVPKYIGKANSMYRRIHVDQHLDDGHERAKELGADLCATIIIRDGDDKLRFHEKDLVQAINPPCNVQHSWQVGGIGSIRLPVPGLLADLTGVLTGTEQPGPAPGLLMGGLLGPTK